MYVLSFRDAFIILFSFVYTTIYFSASLPLSFQFYIYNITKKAVYFQAEKMHFRILDEAIPFRRVTLLL